MSARPAAPSGSASSGVIQEILQQERRAREELQACLLEADAARDRAREQARRIEARADRRVERVHQAGDRLIGAGIRRLEAQMHDRERHAVSDLPGAEIWDAALDRTAQRLVGLEHIAHQADPDAGVGP